MTEENQKNDLEDLSRNWHEKLKALRLAMVKNHGGLNKEPSRQIPESADTVETPSDNELFAGSVHEELSAEQIFTGDDNFYKSLEDAQSVSVCLQSDARQQLAIPVWCKRFSPVRIILAAAIFLIAAMLLCELLIPVTIPAPDSKGQTSSSGSRATTQPQPPVAEAVQAMPKQISENQQPALDAAQQPASLKIAQTFYLNEEYSQALDVYQKLYENLSTDSKEDLMRDFLQLQMALCMERAADCNQASILLRKVLNSNSPAVRVVASYHYGLLEMQKKQYLNARTKAYQAVALIDAIDFNKDWSLSLKRDCYFLAAEAITREVLSFCDADKDLPKDLWPAFGAADDLFINLDETQLRIFLNSGSQRLPVAVLSPQIQLFENQGGLNYYDITCNGASIEELMARFAANANFDTYWNLGSGEIGVRKQLVYLYLPSATIQQFTTVAAGCAGLLAQKDDKSVLNIYNPAVYSQISEHISILSNEAESLWQEFMLRFPDDKRHANVYFALGLLYAPQKQLMEAIGEYKLVANRFSRSSLAPYALLNSSKIKNSLHDYAGGYEDLKQLVEQFPDTETTTNAYLYYADTAGKANQMGKSVKLYTKVYNLSLSSESQIAAALGAGKSSYRLEDYESAEKWLRQYVKLAAGSPGRDLYLAYLYLGKTYLALKNPDSACTAFQYALLGVPSYLPKEEYIETIPVLVDVYMQKGNFVQALDLLEGITFPTLSQKESVEIVLLKSKVLRAMGLVDKALSVLGDKADYVSDSQLKAEIYFQLCECYIKKGDLNLANKVLTESLILAKPGPLMHEIALRLGDVCLKLGQSSQAISVCLQLLDLQPPEQIKQKALELLASAYNQKENYDKAALALLGQWK